jgi:hypothetical protein
MPKINLLKRAPIVPVRPAMRTAQRFGVNPYDNHGAVMSRWEAYARMCGAVRKSEPLPAILRPQVGPVV